MDHAAYAVESQVEQTHWWFVVRRKLFRKTIDGLHLPPEAAILDIGTSTGTNLRMLREMEFTNFQGLDFNDDAIRWCAEKDLGDVRKGDVCNMPFDDAQFDLVLATDIIEHVADDTEALREICRVLKRDGRAIVTVPAFESLWGLQDEVAHHLRRYTQSELKARLDASGLHVLQAFYFNFLLFIPIWIARQLIRVVKPKLESENQLNSPIINSALKAIFTLDIACAAKLQIPFGVSVFALAERGHVSKAAVGGCSEATDRGPGDCKVGVSRKAPFACNGN